MVVQRFRMGHSVMLPSSSGAYVNFQDYKRVRAALSGAIAQLQRVIPGCGDCNYGDGSTGLDADGNECGLCGPQRRAVQAAQEALAGDRPKLHRCPQCGTPILLPLAGCKCLCGWDGNR